MLKFADIGTNETAYVTEDGTPHYDVRLVCKCGAYLYTEDNLYRDRGTAELAAETLSQSLGLQYVVEGCGMRTLAEHDTQTYVGWVHRSRCESK